MAISLEELLSGQKRLEEATQNVERISLEQLKSMKEPAQVAAPKSDSIEKLNSNVVKLVDAVKKNTVAITALTNKKETAPGAKVQQPSIKNADITESEVEQQNFNNKMYNLLEKIEENTRGKAAAGEEEEEEPSFLKQIGKWGTILAVTLGTVAGIFKGWLSAIKIVFGGIYKGIIMLSDYIPRLKKLLFSIEMYFAWAAETIKGVFGKFTSKIMGVFDDAAKIFKSIFGSITESKIFKALSKGFTTVVEYFKPLAGFFDDMKKGSGFISNIVKSISTKASSFMSFFDDIAKWFGSFGKVFGAVANIIKRIAAPVLVIMTIWDTVKGAIAGFEENGIIGGIAGAIEGLINSLIMAPLDMLKSAISWIAGAFGFEEAEKFLDSFSFADMFSELMDLVQKPFNMIRDIFGKVGEWFKGLEIPAIGFEAFGKKVEFGPWKPFADETSTAAAPEAAASSKVAKPKSQSETKAADTAKPTTAGEKKQADMAPSANGSKLENVKPVTNADTVYKSSREAAAADKPAAAGATSVVSAPTTITKQTKNIAVKQPIRNSDSSLNSYLKSRYAT